MKLITKTFILKSENMEIVISHNKIDYEVIAGIGDNIDYEKSYTKNNLPAQYQKMLQLEKGETILNNLVCTDVEIDDF